jgi:hypothetical protein
MEQIVCEARQVLGITINYKRQFKELADRMALDPISEGTLERRLLRHLWTIDEDTGKLARANRERTIEHVLAIFHGGAPPAIQPEIARAQSGSRSTRSPSTSTTDGDTPAGRIRCSDPSRTPRSSSGR